MANNCHGRKLSELLREQQEPFLVHRGSAPQCRSVAEVCRRRLRGLCDRGEMARRGVGDRGGRAVVCGGKAVRMALRRWDLAGCFSCGARKRFRRLPSTGGDIGSDCERHLSPVSVLQLQSDELSHWDDEYDSKPSTSASSPSSDHHPRAAATPRFTFFSRTGSGGGKVRAAEGEDNCKFQTKSSSEGESLATTEQAVVSAWERIATDISRIPRLVELDLSGSAREWRRRIGEQESRLVGESIEAMIFEVVRWEAVRDMLLCSS